MTTQQTNNDASFDAAVFCATGTGLWGFGQWGSGHNLDSAVYPSRDAARKAWDIKQQIATLQESAINAGRADDLAYGVGPEGERVAQLEEQLRSLRA